MPSHKLRAQTESTAAVSELDALRREIEELRLAVRARDDFIAIAAHELRNPMTPLLGMVDIALRLARGAESVCPPRIIVLLETLQGVVQDYVKRATRLLDVSRIEGGNLHLEPSLTDLSALVISVAQRYEVTASRVRSALELEIQPGVTGLWDRLAIEQVVENLLSNALKFGAGKPVALQLRCDERLAHLTVQDHGIGMSPDQQARIFGRFEQVMTQHKGTGFGIGLWVASRLITAMEGQTIVSSNPGEGATFTVTLPFSISGLEWTPA